VSLAGCAGSDSDEEDDSQADKNDHSQTKQRDTSTDRSTPREGDAKSESTATIIAPDDIAVDLPDDPVEATGEVPVQRVAVDSAHESRGFSSGEARIERPFTKTRDSGRVDNAYISVTSEHRGTGRVSGFALSTFQSAWQAPSSGTFRFKIPYRIVAARIAYSDGEDSDVDAAISQDLSATVTRIDDSEVLDEQTKKYFEYGHGEFSDEMQEFFVTTAAKLVVTYALGLSLLGRVLLTVLIQGISGFAGEKPIEEAEFRESHEEIDELTVEFSAEEGDTFALEFLQTVSLAYEQESSIVSTYTKSNTDVVHFVVEEV